MAMACADDVTVATKDHNQLNIVNKHIQLYVEVSGTKLSIIKQ